MYLLDINLISCLLPFKDDLERMITAIAMAFRAEVRGIPKEEIFKADETNIGEINLLIRMLKEDWQHRDIIINDYIGLQVCKSPTNIKSAFEKCANELHMSSYSVSTRWYSKIRKGIDISEITWIAIKSMNLSVSEKNTLRK